MTAEGLEAESAYALGHLVAQRDAARALVWELEALLEMAMVSMQVENEAQRRDVHDLSPNNPASLGNHIHAGLMKARRLV